ncbi:hypothetical protein PRIPAC_81972 [Pristionchus pacificus]|uniref:G protein-coupled receptor n=1 Tax=Pristionchus pacificus TaxID=54126 RepID=A0A2A6CKP6_PRIPA|nr:hypothetical protein PRIPAC_81972 [Pristionchus pacificus]|eukprot:PDM78623.1 G protein-coupled receptor [Pristionchus pacificus]
MSNKYKSVQFTLLVAVCAQTFVPLVCVYIPYLMCIISPFLSMSDAIIIILLIRNYRHGLAKIFGCGRVSEHQIVLHNTQFTTAVQVSTQLQTHRRHYDRQSYEFNIITSDAFHISVGLLRFLDGNCGHWRVTGITLNSILLILIKRFSSAYLGNYKYLLAAFATFDIFLCTLHGLLNPVTRLFIASAIASVQMRWPTSKNFSSGRISGAKHVRVRSELTSFYLGLFTVPFALMNVHFLYRYWSVAHPTCLALFSQGRFIFAISLYPFMQWFVWYWLVYVLYKESDEICLVEVHKALLAIHDQPIYDGWMAMDHWRDGELNTNLIYMIAITMTIIFGSFSTAATLATRTYLHILRATTLSTKHRTTQITLLIAVCAQTFVPLVCVYIPYFMCIMSPFLSLSGFGMVDNFPLLLSIFPGWDALVIIVLIKDYRMGLAKMLGFKRKPETSILVNHTQFTTSVQASVIHQQ